MKHNSLVKFTFLWIFSASILGCSSTQENKKSALQDESPTGLVGKAALDVASNVTVMDKPQLLEALKSTQERVYVLEDRLYGSKRLGNLGLYGELKSCLKKTVSAQYGGAGELTWTEAIDRVSEREGEVLPTLAESDLDDRLQRFKTYEAILSARQALFSEKIDKCKSELSTKIFDKTQSSKVMVSESPKLNAERPELHKLLCEYAKVGASLRDLAVRLFSQGWLNFSDFELAQNLISGQVKDKAEKAKENGFVLNGWRFAFDHSTITIGDILVGRKDAKLLAWSFDRKADVPGGETCLTADDGIWNP